MNCIDQKKQICDLYLNSDYTAVIDIWNSFQKQCIIDLNVESDYLTLESVAISFKNAGYFVESLNLLKQLLQFITKKKEYSTDQEYFDLYYSMASNIYDKLGNDIMEYITLLEYHKYGGQKKELIDYMFTLKRELFLKFKRKFSFSFNLISVLFIVWHILYHYFNFGKMYFESIQFVFLLIWVLWLLSGIFIKRDYLAEMIFLGYINLKKN